MNQNPFSTIVGQDRAKKILEFNIFAQNSTRINNNLLICGPFGFGKNTLCKSYASQLIDHDKKQYRTIAEVNCSTIEKFSSFWDEVLVPYALTNHYTIILDEAHTIPVPVQTALLSITNFTPDYLNTYDYQGHAHVFDYKRFCFLFVTSDPNKLISPLLNRLHRIDLEDYSLEQLSHIITKGLGEIDIDNDVLLETANITRNNPREAVKLVENIKKYVIGRKVNRFNKLCWNDFQEKLSIYPLGLNSIEVKILKLLKERNNLSLTALAGALGLDSQSVRTFYEKFLLAQGYIQVEPSKGRMLSLAGKKLVEEIG
jgi:Holliday junction resolvasome RuvABC ATP-dependent DNA helicase subunit